MGSAVSTERGVWGCPSGCDCRATLREVGFATRDEALASEAAEVAFAHGGVDLTILPDADAVRRRELAERGALIVDPRFADLAQSAGLRRPHHDFVVMPLAPRGAGDGESAGRSILRALESASAMAAPRARDAADAYLGVSVGASEVRDQIRRLAVFGGISILLLGETGTGKERVAQSIHDIATGGRPFVALNCAALPAQLVESELFGHVAGSFTGAVGARKGLMELASDGTLFLDEIGEMPAELQSTLLRALEERAFRPVGGNRDLPLEARVLAATNRLSREDRKRLRSDLYYRLAGVTISLEPLRRRGRADLRLLVRTFMCAFGERHSSSKAITTSALDRLALHPWPGNVRELQAVVGHAAILAGGGQVGLDHVEAAFCARPAPGTLPPPADGELDRFTPATGKRPALRSIPEMERQLIHMAMQECDGNLSRASRLLEVPRTTLRDKLKKYGFR